MAESILQWAGAGLLTAGLSAAVLAGGGVAAADDGAPSNAGGDTSSNEAKATEGESNPVAADPAPADDTASVKNEPDTTGPDTTGPDTTEPDTAGTVTAQQNTGTSPAAEDAEPVETDPVTPIPPQPRKANNGERPTGHPSVKPAVTQPAADVTAQAEPVAAANVATSDVAETDTVAAVPDPERLTPDPVPAEPSEALGTVAAAISEAVSSLFDVFTPNGDPNSPAAQPQLWTAAAAARREIETAFASPSLAQPAAAVTSAAPAGPTLINVVATFAWNIFDTFTKLLDIPPAMPEGGPVSFGRSTVLIDCGPGYTADADWYYPSSGQAEKFIYFQHGFLARSVFYDVTLRELAERNNAVVIAPSITSNYFDCNGCSLTGEPMEAAVARLFEGDRAALVASAQAAGYEGTLPEEFVFMGQSAGAILAAGASGFFYDNAPDADLPDLVGVILYDVSASGGALEHALESLPESVPVLNIAAPPQILNTGGNAAPVFADMRPGLFNGVQMVNGSHSDGFQSSAYGGLVQAIVNLGFGAATPENVEGVQVLTQGWIADMYAGTFNDPDARTGIYGDPGEPGQVVVEIPTDAGLATAYVLPGPPPALSPIEQLIAGFLSSLNGNVFAVCAADSATAVPATDPLLFGVNGVARRASTCSN